MKVVQLRVRVRRDLPAFSASFRGGFVEGLPTKPALTSISDAFSASFRGGFVEGLRKRPEPPAAARRSPPRSEAASLKEIFNRLDMPAWIVFSASFRGGFVEGHGSPSLASRAECGFSASFRGGFVEGSPPCSIKG